MAELSPIQWNLANDPDFIGRLAVTMAEHANAGLQTLSARTCNTQNGSKVLTNVSDTAGIVMGMEVEVSGVPDTPAYVVGVSGSSVTISEAAQSDLTATALVVKPFPSTGVRGTTFGFAKNVAANPETYATARAASFVRSASIKSTCLYDAETGKVKSSATDSVMLAAVVELFLGWSL